MLSRVAQEQLTEIGVRGAAHVEVVAVDDTAWP